MSSKLFDSSVIREPHEAIDFITNILESSTEYSIIGMDLEGGILLWNEGARHIYGYEPEEVVGQANAAILYNIKDVAAGKPREILGTVLLNGKWEGTLNRVRKNGQNFTARVVITPRRDVNLNPSGFLLISKDISSEIHLTEELKAAQFYTRSLIESNIDALMATDALGIITDVNRQMCEMTNYNREELIGSPFKQYFTDSKRAEDGIRKVLSEERVTNYELTIQTKHGKETMVSYNATTFRDAEGNLQGVFASARDITEQKRLEEDLRQVQNYTRGLIEASVDALVTVDPELHITDVNEQMCKMTNYSREELIDSPFPDYFTDSNMAAGGVRRTLEEGFVTNYVLVLRAKNNHEMIVSFNASVFKDTQDRVRGIFASARDITEQKSLEDKLQQAQNYTRALIEASIDPMVTVDQDLIVTDVNQQMVKLAEVSKDRLIGSAFITYFTEPERATIGVRQTLRAGYVTNYELTLKTPSGRETLVSFNASIFKDTEGDIRGIFAVARDITEQKHLEQQIREQQNYSRSLIEASVDALVTVNPQGSITDVNEQMVKLTGYNRKQLIGSPFASYFTDPERAMLGVRQTFTANTVTNYELVVYSKAARKIPVSFNAATFQDTSGDVVGILASARDTTLQKQIEEELREQQFYTRSLIESNIDALMTTDPLGIITDVNRQMCELTNHNREELIGTPFKDYFTDPKRANDGIRKVLTEGRVTNYELTITATNSYETVVSYNATTFQGADGRLRGVFAAARDITKQKRLEEELRQAHIYNRGLIESSVDAMLMVAPDLTITDVNEQMIRLSGYGREQLIGSSFKDYFIEPEQAATGVHKTLIEGYVTNYELTLCSRHRREILVSFNASVFKDNEGNIRGIFAVARDVTEQRRLEEQLRDQQHYNRGLIESSVDALVTVAPDLTITDVNEQMVKLTGYRREELVGSSFKDYFTEQTKATIGVRKTLAEGSVTNYDLVLLSRNGKRTVVSFNAGTFKDMAGEVAGILAAARDITAQKRLEEKLRDQQNYNRSLIESNVDSLMTVDPSGVITDINEQAVKLTGYNRKQLIGSPFASYFTDPERAMLGVRQTFTANTVTNYELVVRSKAARKIPVSFNAATFQDTSGDVVGILAAARDITLQKQIEEELREQQFYTRSLIESNIDALMTTDPLGIITDVNRQMCELTNHNREELIGTPFKDYFTDPKRANDGIRKVLTEGRVTNYELTITATNSYETVVSYNATTFQGADGRLRGVFAAARDITEQKCLEEQLQRKNEELVEQYRRVQEANRLKSEFLANMSHELRTPLNGIIGFTQLIHRGDAGPVSDEQREYLGDILTSSKHLLQLINDVLDLAKVEAGKMTFLPESVDLGKLVSEVRDILRPLAADKRVYIETEIDPTLGNVTVDPSKLKQVLYNFLSNAIKFTAEEGQVFIRLRAVGVNAFCVEVEDTGIGIRPEDVGRLFIEFQQLDTSMSKKHQGTGLGLALTKRIVEAQGGSVSINSIFGKGSTFCAVLPRVSRMIVEHEGMDNVEEQTILLSSRVGAPSVLIIEDEAKDRQWLIQAFTNAGYNVEVAATGTQALARCHQRSFDVITLDLLLPDFSGKDVLQAIRSNGPNCDVPVIIITLVSAKEVGAGFSIHDILSKPVKLTQLLKSLERVPNNHPSANNDEL